MIYITEVFYYRTHMMTQYTVILYTFRYNNSQSFKRLIAHITWIELCK